MIRPKGSKNAEEPRTGLAQEVGKVSDAPSAEIKGETANSTNITGNVPKGETFNSTNITGNVPKIELKPVEQANKEQFEALQNTIKALESRVQELELIRNPASWEARLNKASEDCDVLNGKVGLIEIMTNKWKEVLEKVYPSLKEKTAKDLEIEKHSRPGAVSA